MMGATGVRGINANLLAAHPPVLRPQDATWWKRPDKELARLADAGIVASPLHGHYVVVPPARVGDDTWRPTLEGFALAFAQRIADMEGAALMGTSAARVHGALPRAVGTAVVAGTHRRRRQHTDWGDVIFVLRDVKKLDVERIDTDLTAGWVTTVEQTLLDIAGRPELGDLDGQTASEVLIALAARADWDHVAALAEQQRRRGAFARARWVADAVIDEHAPRPPLPTHRDRYTDARGLRPVAPTAAEPFGVTDHLKR
ncbi:MAG: type IV toxin-antitoxin system AbiEi family antitoxin domain-containing protein [Egibacteraceae bacterium]